MSGRAQPRGKGWAILALLVVPACFKSLHAPTCQRLADCPRGEGYTSCEYGICFKTGPCLDSEPVSADNCCPLNESDISRDADCILESHKLFATLATPLCLDGTLVFTGARVAGADGEGGGTYLITIDGNGVQEVRVGEASGWPLYPLATPDRIVYVPHKGGVSGFRLADLTRVEDVQSAEPSGELAYSRQLDTLVWETVESQVVLYDRRGKQRKLIQLPSEEGTQAEPVRHFMAPAMSQDGDTLYLASVNGWLFSCDLPTALCKGSRPGEFDIVMPPVAFGGNVYFLFALEGEGGATMYVLATSGPDLTGDPSNPIILPMSRPVGKALVTQTGKMVLVGEKGDVSVVDPSPLAGFKVVGSLGVDVAQLPPLLTGRDRLVVVAKGQDRVVSGLLDDGFASLERGLRFDTLTLVGTPPVLCGGALWIAGADGNVYAYTLPEGSPKGGSYMDGVDATHSGQINVSGGLQ